MKRAIKKYYGVLTLICVLIGFLLPEFSIFSGYTPLLLALLVFSLVVEHSIEDLGRIIHHPRFIVLVLASNFLVYPIIGFIFIRILGLDPDISVGVILLSFAPSPIVAALWTEISGGDGTPAISAALTSMLLSVVVYPLVLYALGVASPAVALRVLSMLLFSVFIPAILALILRLEVELVQPVRDSMNLLSSILGLLIIVVAVAHMSGALVGWGVLRVVFLVSVMLLAGFIYGFLVGRRMPGYRVASIYTSGMRDGVIPVGVALTYFSSAAALPATILLVVMPVFTGIVYYLVGTGD